MSSAIWWVCQILGRPKGHRACYIKLSGATVIYLSAFFFISFYDHKCEMCVFGCILLFLTILLGKAEHCCLDWGQTDCDRRVNPR